MAHGGVRLRAGLDLSGLFQPKEICDSTLQMSFQTTEVLHDCSTLAHVTRKPKNSPKLIAGLAVTLPPKKKL